MVISKQLKLTHNIPQPSSISSELPVAWPPNIHSDSLDLINIVWGQNVYCSILLYCDASPHKNHPLHYPSISKPLCICICYFSRYVCHPIIKCATFCPQTIIISRQALFARRNNRLV